MKYGTVILYTNKGKPLVKMRYSHKQQRQEIIKQWEQNHTNFKTMTIGIIPDVDITIENLELIKAA